MPNYPWEKEFYTSGEGLDIWDIATLGRSSEGAKGLYKDTYNALSGGIDRRLADEELRKGLAEAKAQGMPLMQQATDMYGQYAGLADMYPDIQRGLSQGQYSLTGAGTGGQPDGGLGFDYQGAKDTLTQQWKSGMIGGAEYKQGMRDLQQQKIQAAQNPQGQVGQQGGAGKMGMYQAPELERFNFNFEEDPGYQFAKEQGLDAINREMRARGLTGSTAQDQEAMKFATGLASQSYGDAHQRQLGAHQTDQFERMGLAGMGQRSHEFYGGQQERDINRNLGARMQLGDRGLQQLNRQAGSLEEQADWLSNIATMNAQSRANRHSGDAYAAQNMWGQGLQAGGYVAGALI